MTTTNMFLNFGGKWDSPPLYAFFYIAMYSLIKLYAFFYIATYSLIKLYAFFYIATYSLIKLYAFFYIAMYSVIKRTKQFSLLVCLYKVFINNNWKSLTCVDVQGQCGRLISRQGLCQTAY